LANITSKRRLMPKLLSPINSFEGAVRVIRAGADEIYCDVQIAALRHFTLFRGVSCQIPTHDEFKRVVKYAHDHDVELFLTVNIPFIVKEMEEPVRSHIQRCVDEGVDALIIGDMGILSMVKDMGVDIPLCASMYTVVYNSAQVDLLRRLGFTRVTLENYHLTMSEISEIVRNSKVEIEVFCHGCGCSNHQRLCMLLHYRFPEMIRALSTIDEFGQPCMLPFDVHDVSSGELEASDLSILDGYTFCSICLLPELVEMGVAGFKIVGRCEGIEFQEKTTRIYRELIDLIGQGQIESFKERVASLRKNFRPSPRLANLQEVCCERRRCYSAPLFNAPYKVPLSWHAWTKLQTKYAVFED